MEKIDITIMGAGVIGLAIAAELFKIYKDILVVERNSSFGQEISSRNSEVIHAGIYYPKDSLKALTCVEGKKLTYEFCLKNNIAHKRTGKLIVAVENFEIKALEDLLKQGLENGVNDLRLITGKEIKNLEPNIQAIAAVHSPSTGILDTHAFMKKLADQFKNGNGQIAYSTQVMGIDNKKDIYEITVKDSRGESFEFSSRIVINCAGLDSDKISNMVGLDKEEYKIKYNKGDYFRVHNNKAKFINRLIYPIPKEKSGGLGIHATLDLGGGLRLGPDDEYVEEIYYDIDEAKKVKFYESVKKFLPFIELKDLAPDTSGIRPKLQGQNEDFRDFIIKDECDNGLPGFINLIGIESPGFTSSLSVAKVVRELIKNYFF